MRRNFVLRKQNRGGGGSRQDKMKNAAAIIPDFIITSHMKKFARFLP